MLAVIKDQTEVVYNGDVVRGTDYSESFVYLNGVKEIVIAELPDLRVKRKKKLKND